MRTTLKVFGIIGTVIGALAILGSLDSDLSAFVGGCLFLSWGIVTLIYLKKNK